MSFDPVLKLSRKLSAASVRNFNNPYTSIDWPDAIDADTWQFSPEYISIAATDVYGRLDESTRKRLSLYEAANFFSLNIHGEQDLVAQLASRTYRRFPKEVTQYLHHFLDEENKHMVWFGEYCLRYAGRVYADRKVNFPRTFVEGEEDLLFFAKVMIFELIVDAYNQAMAADQRLPAVVRQIHRQHHLDEARHLGFGVALTAHLVDTYLRRWPEAKQQEARSYMRRYLESTWREYYNPSVYADAGLANTYELMQQAWEHPASRLFRTRTSHRCIHTLARLGLWEEEAASDSQQ